MFKKLPVLLCLLIISTSCGSQKDVSINSNIKLSTKEQLEMRLERLEPFLLFCDGGPTDSLPNTITGRQQCDTGDSIHPLGITSTVMTVESFGKFIAGSIGEDGRPYRSPEHARACILPENENNPSCSFSRDHLIGHMFFAISSRNPEYLLKIMRYMDNHDNKFCPGTNAQCGMTPPVWDAMNTTLEYLGVSAPNQNNIVDKFSYIASFITTVANDEFQLSLVAAIINIKIITNTYTTDYEGLLDIIVEKAPYNTNFKYLHNIVNSNSPEINDKLAQELINYIDGFLNNGSKQTVWFWSWNEPGNANAWSLMYMGKLLLLTLP